MSQYHPGDAIPSRCTRCNDVTGHVIVALVGGQIIKVECRACGSVHKYRPPEGTPRKEQEAVHRVKSGTSRTAAVRAARVTDPAARAARTSSAAATRAQAKAAKAAEVIEHDWQRAIMLAPGSTQRPYGMAEHFELDEVIDHPTFGNGIVQELLPPDKMRVLFRDGARLLRCLG